MIEAGVAGDPKATLAAPRSLPLPARPLVSVAREFKGAAEPALPGRSRSAPSGGSECQRAWGLT